MRTELLTDEEYAIVSRLEEIYLQRVITGIISGNTYMMFLGRLQLKELEKQVLRIVSRRS